MLVSCSFDVSSEPGLSVMETLADLMGKLQGMDKRNLLLLDEHKSNRQRNKW